MTHRTFRMMRALVVAVLCLTHGVAQAAYLNTGTTSEEERWEHGSHTHGFIWAEWGRSTDDHWSLRLWDSWNAEFSFPGFNGAVIASGGQATVGDTAGEWDGAGDGEGMLHYECNVGDEIAATCQFRFRYAVGETWYTLAGASWARVSRGHWGSAFLGFDWSEDE